MTWSLKDADRPFSPPPPRADPETHHLQGAPGPSHSLPEPPHHPLPHRCASRRDQPDAHAVLPSHWGFTLREAGGGGHIPRVRAHQTSSSPACLGTKGQMPQEPTPMWSLEGDRRWTAGAGAARGKASVFLRTVPSGNVGSPRRKARLVAEQHECASWQ